MLFYGKLLNRLHVCHILLICHVQKSFNLGGSRWLEQLNIFNEIGKIYLLLKFVSTEQVNAFKLQLSKSPFKDIIPLHVRECVCWSRMIV